MKPSFLVHAIATGSMLSTTLAVDRVLNAFGQESYGVDVSFPVHYLNVLNKEDNPLGNRQSFYEEFIDGCREHYGGKLGSTACDITEEDRADMSLRQPASMQNYTDTGFKKVQAPKQVFDMLVDYWKKNYERREEENWPKGNTYVNHWKSPTYMVNVESGTLRGGGHNLKRKIWNGVKPILEEWTGMELEPSSMYGIRMYTDGAVLSPHADRTPLISSCIINVAQDVDEDWPLEVFGRDGLAYNVTMQPGDMVLYESHSLIHGRPFSLKGRYFANIFIHFQPTGKLLRERDTPVLTDASDEDLPIYILRGSPEADHWMEQHPPKKHVRIRESPAAAATPLEQIAQAAATGDVDTIAQFASTEEHLLHQTDKNGWMPIHEAARGGHLNVVKLLVEHGADINSRTHSGKGSTPMNLAVDSHGLEHEIVEYFSSLGALNIGPEL